MPVLFKILRDKLIARVLGDTEVLTVQTSGDRLAVMTTTDIVVLGTQVVMHLCEVSLLVGSISVAK